MTELICRNRWGWSRMLPNKKVRVVCVIAWMLLPIHRVEVFTVIKASDAALTP